jgi:hypothetical protein
MQRFRVILVWTLIGMVVFFSLGLYTGYRWFKPKPQAALQTVNAQAILTALHDRGFLVSQTYVFDTPVTIDRSSGNSLKDFFFGQTIEARGTMEVNMGVDLAQVTANDITIDEAANTITIRIPKTSLFNTRLVGPIQLKNNQGILKKLLNADDGYNDALSLLSKTAEEMAQKDEIISRANDNAVEDITRILGYVTQGKTVKVHVK